jgi:heme oxygenase
MPAKLDMPFLKNVYACLADLDAGYKNGQYAGNLPMLNKLARILYS